MWWQLLGKKQWWEAGRQLYIETEFLLVNCSCLTSLMGRGGGEMCLSDFRIKNSRKELLFSNKNSQSSFLYVNYLLLLMYFLSHLVLVYLVRDCQLPSKYPFSPSFSLKNPNFVGDSNVASCKNNLSQTFLQLEVMWYNFWPVRYKRMFAGDFCSGFACPSF